MYSLETYVVTGIGIIIIWFIIFLIFREVNCWYFKINARKKLLEEMVKNQKEIIRLLNRGKVEHKSNSSEVKISNEKPEQSVLSIGQKVKTLVEKNNLPAGSIVRIDSIDGVSYVCSQEMAEIGKYNFWEVEAI